jgi:hypothetical protein
MKARIFSALCLLCLLQACVVPSPDGAVSSRKPLRVKPGSYSYPQPGGSAQASATTIQPGETSSAYRLRQERQQREAVSDAQVMYHRSEQDILGRSSESGIYRSTGGVIEEVHIGSQQIPVVPGQGLGPAPTYNNVYQGGYVPPGTTGIYDPRTGRVLRVRR